MYSYVFKNITLFGKKSEGNFEIESLTARVQVFKRTPSKKLIMRGTACIEKGCRGVKDMSWPVYKYSLEKINELAIIEKTCELMLEIYSKLKKS